MHWLEQLGVGREVAATAVAIVVAGALIVLVRIGALRISDPASRRFVSQTFSYVTVFGTLLMIAKIWIHTFNLSTLFGLTAAGFVLALKDPIASFGGWLFILLRHPLRVGDRIQVGENIAGDVIDIRPFMFTLQEIGQWVGGDQPTGRIVHVPNSVVFTAAISNYTAVFPAIWNEIKVNITFESDYQRAEQLLHEIVMRRSSSPDESTVLGRVGVSRQYEHLFRDEAPSVWLSVTDYAVRLSLRYQCPPRRRRSSEMRLWRDVLDAFRKEPDIQLAYPTQRFYDRAAEIDANAPAEARRAQ